MTAAGELVINPVALAEVLRGPTGPVARYTLVVGTKVRLVTVASLKPGFVQDWLGPRIVTRVLPGGGVSVGSTRTKTTPHGIDGNPLLVFTMDGQLVFTRHVNHPGSDFTNPTEAHPLGYLQEKLLTALEAVKGTI